MRWVAWLAAALLLGGCASPVVDEADRLARAGDFEGAFRVVDAAARERPDDAALRTARARARERVVQRLLSQADLALGNGRSEEAARLADRLRALEPDHPRLPGLAAEVQRQRRQQRQVEATAAAAPAVQAPMPAPALGPAFQKPVSLEFREAPLRQVFETLSRTTGLNVVFDKDVRADAKVTLFLRGVTLDEAVRVILATQQLDRKLLNDSTLLVYPNTSAKQREHQELVTKSLYLVNAEVKNVLPLVRTMAKTRDLHADERLNALVVRDTPEVVAMIERLLATIDLPDPEVTLAIEVLEVASDRVDELGLSWPTEIAYGIPGASGGVVSSGSSLRGSVANPAVVASLKGSAGTTNLLANPTIRARSREKARVQIGEKLPLFTTTSATANVGASTTVSLIDVGLKLDLEPQVMLDDEVVIKLGLEVSNLLRTVSGPNGSLAYQLGTRLATTSLRLHDGQTQVLAGLISDEDRKSADGLPWLASLPVVGRLFGVQNDTRNKTEIVMLVTPRIVRRLSPPAAADAVLPSGTDTMPGSASLRLRPGARAAVGPNGLRAAPAPAAAPAAEAEGPAAPVLQVSATAEAAAGETVSLTLANRSPATVRGELQFDTALLQSASAPAPEGRLAFEIGPQGDAVQIFRVLPAAAGQSAAIAVGAVHARDAQGNAVDLRVDGEARVQVRAATAEVRP